MAQLAQPSSSESGPNRWESLAGSDPPGAADAGASPPQFSGACAQLELPAYADLVESIRHVVDQCRLQCFGAVAPAELPSELLGDAPLGEIRPGALTSLCTLVEGVLDTAAAMVALLHDREVTPEQPRASERSYAFGGDG
jgi:hypothetical protein